MAKLKVQRLVKVWVEDIYNVDEITQEVIDAGSYEVFDDDGNLIYTQYSVRENE